MGITILVPKLPKYIRTHGVDQHGWDGIIRIAVKNEETGRIKYSKFYNTIMLDGKDYIATFLGTLASVGIKYVALGTSSTAVVNTQHQLVAESFRKAITLQTPGAAGSGNILTTTYIASFEANIAIAEIGWFAGPSATSSANTGTMIARVLYSHTKVSTESLQIDRTDQF